jgi:hypothetical protein
MSDDARRDTENRGRRAPVRLALMAFVVALALRLYGLGHENFWIDEIFQLRVSAQPLADIVANYRPGVDYKALVRDQAPLSHLVFHFFVGDGNGEARARLPSAVAGALAVAAALVLAVRLLPLQVATLGTVLLVLSPLDLWYSQEARFYALWKLEATLSYVALVCALAGGRLRWWAAYCLAAIAGTYTCILHGLVLLAQGITALWYGRLAGRTRSTALAFAVASVVILVAALPVVRVVVAESDRSGGSMRPVRAAALPYTLFAYAAGFSLGPTVEALHALPSPWQVVVGHPSLVLVFAVFLPLTLAGAFRLGVRSRAASVFLPWLLVPPLGVFTLSMVSNISYNVRYSFASLPAFLFVVAAGCLSGAAQAPRRAAVGAVLACSLVSLGRFYWDETYDKEQVRAAVAYVQATDPGETRVVVVGELRRAVDHYARGSRIRSTAACEAPAVGTDGGGAGGASDRRS